MEKINYSKIYVQCNVYVELKQFTVVLNVLSLLKLIINLHFKFIYFLTLIFQIVLLVFFPFTDFLFYLTGFLFK